MRFYHVDPDRLWRLPQWQLELLVEQLPALKAEEQLSRIDAASAPYAKDYERRSFIQRLLGLVRYREPRPPRVQVAEVDPQKAAQWFAQQGIRVRNRQSE